MKGFGIFAIVLASLSMALGLLMQMGNPAEQTRGAMYLGNGFMSLLLGLIVVALADIRNAVTKRDEPKTEQL